MNVVNIMIVISQEKSQRISYAEIDVRRNVNCYCEQHKNVGYDVDATEYDEYQMEYFPK